jgi:hypothetical protein
MKKKKPYKFPLRLDEEQKKPLEKIAKKNNRSVNGEIKVAVTNHIGLNQ